MKAKRLLLLLLMLPFMGVGCAKASNAIVVPTDYDTLSTSDRYLHAIKGTEVSALLHSKSSFALYVFDPDCTACKAITPIVNSYIKNSQAYIYSFDVTNKAEFSQLVEEFPRYFYNNLLTPTMYVFNNAEGTAIEQERLKSDDSLRRIMNQYLQLSNIRSGNTYVAFDKFVNVYDQHLVIAYSGSSISAYEIINKHVFNHNSRTKGVFLINTMHIDDELKNVLKKAFGEDYTNKFVVNTPPSYQPFALTEANAYAIDDYFKY